MYQVLAAMAYKQPRHRQRSGVSVLGNQFCECRLSDRFARDLNTSLVTCCPFRYPSVRSAAVVDMTLELPLRLCWRQGRFRNGCALLASRPCPLRSAPYIRIAAQRGRARIGHLAVL